MLCKNCGEEKKYHAKDMCQKCYHIIYAKKHYILNKEKYRENEKIWNLENIEKHKEYYKRWYNKNPNYQKIWRLNNLDKARNLDKIYYQKNKDKYKDRMKLYHKLDYQKNKDKYKYDSKIWREKNKERDKELHRLNYYKNKINYKLRSQKWLEKNPGYYTQYVANRLQKDINFKIHLYYSTLIRNTLKNRYSNKAYKTIELLGCSIQECRQHLEKQFKEGMTWNNHGKEWHIDHIIPCALFDLKDPEQQKLCFHYTNLQPLWKKENLEKGCKILEEELLIT